MPFKTGGTSDQVARACSAAIEENRNFALERARYPLGPFVIGLVLAPLMEQKLRSGLMMSAGSLAPLVTQPAALLFLVLSVILLVWPLCGSWRRRARQPASGALKEGS